MRNYSLLLRVSLAGFLILAGLSYFLVFSAFAVFSGIGLGGFLLGDYWTTLVIVIGLVIGEVVLAFTTAVFYDRWKEERDSLEHMAMTPLYEETRHDE